VISTSNKRISVLNYIHMIMINRHNTK